MLLSAFHPIYFISSIVLSILTSFNHFPALFIFIFALFTLSLLLHLFFSAFLPLVSLRLTFLPYFPAFLFSFFPSSLLFPHPSFITSSQVEKVSSGKADCLIYPPLPGSAPLAPPPRSSVSAVAPPSSPSVAAVGPPPFSQVQVRTEQSCPRPAVTAPPGGRSSSITACEKTAAAFNHRGRCQPPAAHQPAASPSGPDPSARTDDREALEKLRDLLVKYSHGLWAPALPRLFSDTYKVPLPEHLLDDLSLLMDFCRVDYPMAHDKTKVRTKTSAPYFSAAVSENTFRALCLSRRGRYSGVGRVRKKKNRK